MLDDRLIWFAHCPKAGGTSVERFLVDRFGDGVGHLHWGWDLWWKRGGWRCANPPNSPQHLIWEDAQRALPCAPDVVFALVRDPVARLVSEYRYQGRTRRGTRAGRLLARLPFSLWLRLMLCVMRCNPYAFDNHLRPQSDFVPPDAEIFRLEDGMDRVGFWLMDQVECNDLPAGLPHLLPSQGATFEPDVRDQALIAEVFATDYSRFGYRLPLSSPTARSVTDLMARLLAFPIWKLERRGMI